MNLLIRRFYQIKIIMLLACFRACAFLCRRRAWVLFERGTEARDNAYFFYRYLKEQHPEQKVYYIIDKKSPDYHKVSADAVHFGSLKNYWVIATAQKLISTHCYKGLPHMNAKLFRFFMLNQKFYFLQHGVTYNNIEMLYFDQTEIRGFCCGAKPEYTYICNEFRYPAEVAKYTGFARYDTLHDIKTKRQILIMPTWRNYITDEKSFLESEYYRRWNLILQNRQLAECLKENDLTLIFYPHFEVQKYLHWFQPYSDHIILGDFAHFDVQTLLKESKLLITDYSSVFFDFAYMRKPVVYFQFDQNKFFARHYNRGYFSYTEMGFGPVSENAESVIEAVLQSVKCVFSPTDEYIKRMEYFFPLHDQKNCERIYDAICGS